MSGAIRAQPSFHPRLHAMGGASVAVSEGIGASFSNPANLMIRNHAQGFLIYGGMASFQTSDGVTDIESVAAYREQSAPFRPYNESWTGPQTQGSLTTASFDALVAGVSITQPGFGFSLAWRIRGENTYSSGADWYGSTGSATTDHHLKQDLWVAHEFGAGFAWEYDLISGWLTDLSKLFVGIHPKLVVPGMMVSQTLVSHHGVGGHIGSYSLRAAGPAARRAIGGITDPLTPGQLLSPTGLGGGVDMGVTYIIGIGNEQSLGTRRRNPTRNSLRLAASITDLGLIRYGETVASRQSGEVTTPGTTAPAPLGKPFHAAPGQFEAILAETVVERDIVSNATDDDIDALFKSLPSAFHIGGGLQLNRLLLTADLTTPLAVHPLYGETRTLRLGGELKLLRVLPLRAGAVFRGAENVTYSAGFGLDFRNLDFSLASSFRVGDGKDAAFRPTGLSMASVLLRF